MVGHCLGALPNEGCGLFAMDGNEVVEVYEADSLWPSPRSYTVPPETHHSALVAAEAEGWRLGGVFHSHPSGDARMSMIDVRAALEPEWVYLVVGLRDEPELRGWRVIEGQIEEVGLE